MNHDVNHFTCTGTLATTPTARVLETGLPVANAKLRVYEARLADRGNTVKETFSTLNLVFWGQDMTHRATQTAEGDRVAITGEVRTRSTSPTENRHVTEVIVRSFHQLLPEMEEET